MGLHDWHRRWADGAAGIRVHEIRVDIGEALELGLVDAGQNQAVRGCQGRRRPSEELVEVLAAAATRAGSERRRDLQSFQPVPVDPAEKAVSADGGFSIGARAQALGRVLGEKLQGTQRETDRQTESQTRRPRERQGREVGGRRGRRNRERQAWRSRKRRMNSGGCRGGEWGRREGERKRRRGEYMRQGR